LELVLQLANSKPKLAPVVIAVIAAKAAISALR
jgi:hypothetical protein